MIRIAHLADLHLGQRWLHLQSADGVNLREQDTYDAAHCLVRRAVDERVDLCVIAGDLFDTTNPTTLARSHAFRLVQKLHDAEIPVVVIGGNHDAGRSHGPSPLTHLAEFFGCELFLEQGQLDIAGVRLHLLPYEAVALHCTGKQSLAALDWSSECPNVIVGHAYAMGSAVKSPPEQICLPGDLLRDPRASLVLLGHIHQHVALEPGGRIFYSGAAERRNFGEADDEPGMWLHTLSPTGELQSESVPLVSLGVEGMPRELVILRFAQEDQTIEALGQLIQERTRRLAEAGRLDGAIVRIQVTSADALLRQSSAPSTWGNRIKRAGAAAADVQLFAAETPKLAEAEMGPTEGRLDDALREYLKAAEADDLTELAAEIFEEAAR